MDQHDIPIGQVSSIASIVAVFYKVSDLTTRGVDKYIKFFDAKLVDMNLKGNGTNLPTNTNLKFNGGKDLELALLGAISSSGTANLMHNITDLTATGTFKLSLNFSSATETFARSLSTIGSASPFVTTTTTHSEGQPATVRWVAFVTTDALIEFRGTDTAISEIV